MAQSSQDILNQLQQQYGNPGDAANLIESTIKDAYAPSVKNLIQEGNDFRAQYYPAFFNKAQELGTGAGDMSPAARLAAMQNAGESMGQLYRTNLGLRDYYNTDINNLVGRAQNQYSMGYGALKDMYGMTLQGEQQRAAAAATALQNKLIQTQIDSMNTKTTPVDPTTIPEYGTWDDASKELMKTVGAVTVGPVLRGDGQVIGYKYKLPDGRIVQLDMTGTDIPAAFPAAQIGNPYGIDPSARYKTYPGSTTSGVSGAGGGGGSGQSW